MKVKVPHALYKDQEKYSLFIDYAPHNESGYLWRITYVGEHGILFKEEDKELRVLEDKVFEFVKTNNLDYE
jgi:hypothetical protein